MRCRTMVQTLCQGFVSFFEISILALLLFLRVVELGESPSRCCTVDIL